jgi:ATP-dependent Clp protease ATP-binding subunit ClpC
MFERFTEQARQVVVLAQDEARTLKHNYIGTEHILLGLLREEEGLAARVLGALDITLEGVRAQVGHIVGQGDEVTTGQIPFTPRAKKVLELSLREALELGHNYIGTEHILLGLVRENEGVATRILLDFNADADKIRNEIIRVLSGVGPELPRVPRQARQAPFLLEALERAKVRLIDEQRFEEAAALRDKQRRLDDLLAEIQGDLLELEPGGPPPSLSDAEAARWEYTVRSLEGPVETWPERLSEWRREGWELLTITSMDGVQHALLERRT